MENAHLDRTTGECRREEWSTMDEERVLEAWSKREGEREREREREREVERSEQLTSCLQWRSLTPWVILYAEGRNVIDEI